jgi:hypothetical protein
MTIDRKMSASAGTMNACRRSDEAGDPPDQVLAALRDRAGVLLAAAAGEAAGGTGVTEFAQVRNGEQQHQQDDHEQVRSERPVRVGQAAVHGELGQLALQDADRETSEHGRRQAHQPGGDDDGERLEHHERERVGRQRDPRGEQDAGESGKRRAERPARRGHPVGRNRRELGQLAVVHDGAHLAAELGAALQQAERDTRDQDHDQRADRVHTDVVPADSHRLVREDRRRVGLRAQAPDPGAHTEREHHDAEAGHQRLGRRGAPTCQRPEDQPFEQHTDAG